MQPVEPTGSVLTSITPTFRWNTDTTTLPRPVTYRLRLGPDAALGELLVDTVLTDVERYDLRRPLKPGSLYWRVDATAVTGARDSTATVGPLAVPPWAALTTLSVPGGTTTDDPQPTFTWTSPNVASPPGPFRYDLFVRRAATGETRFGVLGLTSTSFRSADPLDANIPYTWMVVSHAGSDTSLARSAGTFLVLDPSLPPTTLLFQNFPNPFPAGAQEATCIWFDLATAGLVELEVLDLRGNLVRRFLPGPDYPAILPAGRYGRGAPGGPPCDVRLTWNGAAADGRMVPPGVYLSRLRVGGQNFFRRMVFRGPAR